MWFCVKYYRFSSKWIRIARLFISLQFCSCITEYPKGIVFNEEEFNTQKEKWEKLNLKNYSFEYNFRDGCCPSLYTGYVKVENGKGTVEFKLSEDVNSTDESIPEEVCKYYLTCIEDFLDNIYKVYETAVENYNNGDIVYSKITVYYDEINGFPKSTFNSTEKNWKDSKSDLSGISSSTYTLQISEFSIVESE